MKKKILIGSIIAAVILVLVSFTSVVGFQTVQTSQNKPIKERNNQKELWFQTISDLANHKEIQQIIHKSPMLNENSFFKDAKLTKPITKQQLRHMYFIGLILSKIISKSRIQSMIQPHQLITPEMQQKIDAVIENDAILKEEITQLSNSDCECDNPETTEWGFPMICTAILSMMGVASIPWVMLMIIGMIPPNALDEMLELLFLMLSPFLILWELFNCSLPEVNHPFPSNETPADGEQNVSLDLTELSFQLTDEDTGLLGLMSYKVTTSPNIGEGEDTLVRSGTYTVPVQGLKERTNYKWELLLYAGDFEVTPMSHRYTFTTESFTPIISNPSPLDNAEFLPLNTSNISFDLVEPQHELMNWTVETQPDIGSGDETGVINGRYTVPISGLDYFTTYNWFVNVTDGTHWSNETFSFRTTTENTVVIEPTDDATISDPDDNVNFGTSEALRLRSIGGGWDLEALIKFNLSSIPSNVTIVIAGLKAFYYRYERDDPKRNEVNLYRNKNDWDEETVTWNNKPSHVTEPSTFARIPEMINNWIFWNVTGDAQMFYNNSTINYGWTIQDMSGTWQNEEPYFRSKEYIEYHPHLIIGYE